MGVTGQDGCIHLFGGEKGGNKHRIYDENERKWSEGTPMTKKRLYGGAAIDPTGKIYLYGGFDGNNYLKDMSIYDPEKKEWQVS